jgi:copper transport protein
VVGVRLGDHRVIAWIGQVRFAAALGIVLGLAATLTLPGTALGHALPQSSVPSAGSQLTTPPSQVSIIFGERPDPNLSTIKVLDTTGTAVTSGSTAPVAGNPVELAVPLKANLPDGVYTIAWRTVSAVDGHLATGSFAFGIGVAPPVTGSSTSSATTTPSAGPSDGAIVGRWLLYLGLVGLLGLAVFGILIARGSPASVRRVLPFAWLVAAIGTGLVIAFQLSDAGVDLGRVFETSFGGPIVARSVPILVVGLAVVPIWIRRGRERTALIIVAIGAAGAMVADVSFSHAAAGGDPLLDVPIQVLHVVAVGFWLGGLLGLLVNLRGEPDETSARLAKRFSRLATLGIASVALTGLLRAISEIGTIDRLISTDFGHLVIAKTALLGVLALLGAVNHFHHVPAAGRALRGLRRVGSAELLVGGTVLLLSASLVNLAPPTETAGGPSTPPPAVSPLILAGSDFGTSLKLRLEVSPGMAGFNTFKATVTDYDTGAPLAAATGVSLRFNFPGRADVGSSRLDLPPTGPGVFSAAGSNLSLVGAWQVTVLVVNGTASVEVPVELITRTAPATIDVNAVTGLPTIYTVHLSAGRSIQVYLDPGKTGPNEVHTTFFDAAGNELAVPSVAMVMGPSGGAASILTPRELEPGHFVADTILAAGTYTLSLAGPAPNGDQLTTQLDIPVTP